MKPENFSLGAVVAIFYTLSECKEARAQGRILATQRMNAVGDFLGTFSGIEGTTGMKGTTASTPKRLKRKEVAV